MFMAPIPILNSRPIPHLARKAFKIFRKEGIDGLRRRIYSKIQLGHKYPRWLQRYDTLTRADRAAIKQHVERLFYTPLISLIMPVYDTPEKWLRRAIESVIKQLYPNWELCIADDASSKPHVKEILTEYRAKDARIKVMFRSENGRVSVASNSAIDLVTGEFIALLDHDDELSEHALYMVAVELNAHTNADLIYSDEDKIDEKGQRYDPYCKPDWNPTLFLAQNFVRHLAVYRARVVKEIGGFHVGYEGSQDWDLAMRVSERIPSSHIRHIPYILYHWRALPGSIDIRAGEQNCAIEVQRKVLKSHFDRIGKEVQILPGARRHWRIRYPLPQPPPRVTLIISTRNGFDLLHPCVESIYERTTYRHFEVIIVDNQSNHAGTLNYLAQLKRERGVRVLRYDAPFNYSAINNFAVQHARSEIIGLLNNDVEVIAPDWLEEMVSYAVQPEIGAVGAMLYYPDQTIQHAGVIVGLGGTPGVADHVHKNRPRGYHGQASRALLCQNLSAVTAACLIIRRQVFEDAGGFNETSLAIAFNDVDLCLRIREKGYQNVWTPHAELFHHEQASRGYDDTPEKESRFEKESEYMRQYWGELLLNDPAYNPNLALDREPFTLAFPPRVRKPWLPEEAQKK
jgi:O-antigen biosynthesis protein